MKQSGRECLHWEIGGIPKGTKNILLIFDNYESCCFGFFFKGISNMLLATSKRSRWNRPWKWEFSLGVGSRAEVQSSAAICRVCPSRHCKGSLETSPSESHCNQNVRLHHDCSLLFCLCHPHLDPKRPNKFKVKL